MNKSVIFGIASLFLLLPKAGFAQEFHVSIEPTALYINATPPALSESPIIVTNLSNKTINLSPQIIPFEPKENGKINLLLDTNDKLIEYIQDRLSIADENGIIENIELRPSESKKLKVIIDSQIGDPVDDYYFSLVFMSNGTQIEDSSSASIPSGIAANIMLSLGPKSKAYAQITEFSAPKFIGSGPVPITLKIENKGNHLISPSGTVKIKNMFGKEVAKLSIPPQYLLKDSTRYFIDDNQSSPSAELTEIINEAKITHPSIIWQEKFLMGRYTATAEISLGEGEDILIQKTSFTSIPVQMVAVISGFIFIILGIALRINSKLAKKRL